MASRRAEKVKLLLFFMLVLLLLKFLPASASAKANETAQHDDTREEEERDAEADMEWETGAEIGCDILENRQWQFVCNGIYSRELKLKYKDRIVNEGTPYRVWHDLDASPYSRLLIAFYESKLFACRTLRFANNQFYCNVNATPLKLPHSELHCLPFVYSYADNLREHCQHADRRVRAAASVIQYSRAGDANNGAAVASLKRATLLAHLLHLMQFAQFHFRVHYALWLAEAFDAIRAPPGRLCLKLIPLAALLSSSLLLAVG